MDNMEEIRQLRYDEYLICKSRGHSKPLYAIETHHMWSICEYCNTQFRYENKMIEQNMPENRESKC